MNSRFLIISNWTGQLVAKKRHHGNKTLSFVLKKMLNNWFSCREKCVTTQPLIKIIMKLAEGQTTVSEGLVDGCKFFVRYVLSRVKL